MNNSTEQLIAFLRKNDGINDKAKLAKLVSDNFHISKDNRPTQARFACVECGFEENADVVGAINVLRAGHARLACEVSGATVPPTRLLMLPMKCH